MNQHRLQVHRSTLNTKMRERTNKNHWISISLLNQYEYLIKRDEFYFIIFFFIYLTSGHDDNTNSDKWRSVLSIMGTSLLLFIYFNQKFIGKLNAGKTTVWWKGGRGGQLVVAVDDYESTEYYPVFFLYCGVRGTVADGGTNFSDKMMMCRWIESQKSGNSWWQIFQWTHRQTHTTAEFWLSLLWWGWLCSLKMMLSQSLYLLTRKINGYGKWINFFFSFL